MKNNIVAIALLAAAVCAGSAHAQDKWPSKPITNVVPFPAGGTTDVLARRMAGGGAVSCSAFAARAETATPPTAAAPNPKKLRRLISPMNWNRST